MSFRQELDSYFELAKPRITTLLLIVALASYSIAAGTAWSWWGFLVVFTSVGALGTGIFALNHYFERHQDAKMVRTRDRPIPSGKISPIAAQVFGWGFLLVGLAISFFAANVLTGCLALFTAVSYLAIYTPLKYKTAYHTALGALPGAVPPLAGWAVATGTLDVYAWVLFGVLFLWQFPHFLSIEMMYKDDYAKADVKVLPVVDVTGVHVAWQVVGACLLLIAVTAVPLLLGVGSWITVAGNAVLGLAFLWFGVRAVQTKEKMAARHLLRASVSYLPLVFLLLYFHP
jgi:protoheme IX farnesyltransferase